MPVVIHPAANDFQPSMSVLPLPLSFCGTPVFAPKTVLLHYNVPQFTNFV
jgi:hypothetical protein